MAVSQENRPARVRLDLGSDSIILMQLEVVERLSEPFVITAEVKSPAGEIDFLPHLGKPVGIDVYDDAGDVAKHFHGLLTEAMLTDYGERGYAYRLTIRPWLWLLNHTQDYKVFQNQNAVDVMLEVFDKLGFTHHDITHLEGAPEKREYCVQFGETALNFVSRLMEEEGIYYFFEHEANQHTLVLCNASSSHKMTPEYDSLPFAPPSGEARRDKHHVMVWDEEVSTNTFKVSLRDWDFTTPASPLKTDATAPDEGDKKGPEDKLELYDYPGRFQVKDDAGKPIAQHRLEAARSRRRLFHGEALAPALALGRLYKLSEHDVGRYNEQYLVIALTYRVNNGNQQVSGAQQEYSLTIHFDATPSDVPFRPAKTARKPVVRGPQTAIVSGPADDPIHVDKYGRVKVHFHWDRLQAADENCSCWVRVSEGWAGPSMGSIMLPRVGHEVIVNFLDGDPDRPIITGRVYHATNTQPGALPGAKTVAGWKSQTVYGKSTQDYAGAVSPPTEEPGFNAIEMEDMSGAEMVYIRAQRDMSVDVKRDEKYYVHRDQFRTVGRNLDLTVETGNETHKVAAGSRTTTINQDETLTVEKGNMATKVDMGNMSTKVAMGNYDLKCDLGAVSIEAMQSITLKVGQSSIVIDQMGVTIKGMMIKSEAQIQNTTKGLMTNVEGSAMTIVKGGIVMIN